MIKQIKIKPIDNHEEECFICDSCYSLVNLKIRNITIPFCDDCLDDFGRKLINYKYENNRGK